MVKSSPKGRGAAAPKRTRKVRYRFPGIDRSTSKAVYELESQLALARRQLKNSKASDQRETPVVEIYRALTPRNRKLFADYGHFLLGTPKKT